MSTDLLIDVSRLLGRAMRGRMPTGIDRVCLAYLERFASCAGAVLQVGAWRKVLSCGDSQAIFALLLEGPPYQSGRAVRKILMQLWGTVTGHGARPGLRSLYLSHSGIEHPSFSAWIRRTGQQPFFFVHDLIPLTHPEYCRPGIDEEHARRISTMLIVGRGLIVNSHGTLTTLQDFAQQRSLPMPPVLLAPLAPATTVHAGAPFAPMEQPYFIVVGTIEARKNHLLLLQVWRELALRMGAAVPHLVIIGQRGWECEGAIDMLERCPALKGCVHEMGPCPDATLMTFLRHARALLFPSFVEGYGLPLVEALSAGVPVIASDLAVFREIAGNVPDYLGPLDGPGWANAVCEYNVTPSPRRESQLRRMSGFIAPKWADHLDEVQRFLDAV